MQVFGKIVFFNPAFTSYKDVRRIRYEGAYRAAVHGAVAVVIRSNTPYVSEHAHAGLLVYPNGTHRIPAAAVSTHDADRLGALLRGGTDVVFRLEMASHRAGMAQTENLVAEIRGRAETEADLVVLAAHVDSWDVGQGVLDDGTGIFLSWNALAILKILDLRPRRTLRLVVSFVFLVFFHSSVAKRSFSVSSFSRPRNSAASGQGTTSRGTGTC